MEPRSTEEAEANPKLGLPGQRGRRRRSAGREEGFSPSFVRSTRAMPRGLQRRGFLCRAARLGARRGGGYVLSGEKETDGKRDGISGGEGRRGIVRRR